MKALKHYLNSDLDLSILGLSRGSEEGGYFCTPLGARVIGWAGVDGIHYCTIEGQGETIFAVSPMNFGDYIHPIAESFDVLLRMLLSCHSMDAMEQCYAWVEDQFTAFLLDYPATTEMQEKQNQIREIFQLEPMEDVFGYIKHLQDNYDLSTIQYSEEYYDTLGLEYPEVNEKVEEEKEWKVTWNGDFFYSEPDDITADPLAVNVWFQWAGIEWFVPEIYPFPQGVILHLFGKVDPDIVHKYEYSGTETVEEQERRRAENPLNLLVRHELSIDDLTMRPGGGTGLTWMPDQNWNEESKWVLRHYGLDLDFAWQIHRIKFFWPVGKMLDISKMSLTMKQYPVPVSGTHFKTPLTSESVILTHPQSGAAYTLHIEDLKQETFDMRVFRDQTMEYPTCYTQMFYRLEPDLNRNQFRIVDCAQGDSPRYKEGVPKPEYPGAVSVGIIGGASGPVTITARSADGSSGTTHFAASALHFEPAEEIEWRIVFQETPNDDLTISLL